ncbi:MAG: hypothetical protein GEV06_24730, partial [Luteitalea sp.]|nr:hypothetical protein [Luteitalea sp.]
MSRFHGFVGVLLASGLGGLAVGQTVVGQGGDAPGEQTQVEAATVVRCTNEPSDAAMINAVIAASQPGDAIVFDGPCQITETIKLLGNRSYSGQSRTGTVLWQGQGATLP